MAAQMEYLFWLLGLGAILGAVFDLYNTVIHPDWLKWLRSLVDVLFWVAAAVGVYVVAFVHDNGKIRIHTFALLGVGFIIYRLTLHDSVVRSAFLVVRLLNVCYRFAAGLVRVFVIVPLHVLWTGFTRALGAIYWLGCKLEDIAVWLLQQTWHFSFGIVVKKSPWMQKFIDEVRNNWEEFGMMASNWLKSLLLRGPLQ